MTSLSSASPGLDPAGRQDRLFGPARRRGGARLREGHPERGGFFTDTSVCIGCKACEVACKEWNTLPMDDAHGTRDVIGMSGMSYENTGKLGANSWRAEPAPLVVGLALPAVLLLLLRWPLPLRLTEPAWRCRCCGRPRACPSTGRRE